MESHIDLLEYTFPLPCHLQVKWPKLLRSGYITKYNDRSKTKDIIELVVFLVDVEL